MLRGHHRRLAVLVPIAVGGLVVAGIGVAGKARIAGKPAPTKPTVVKHDTSPPLKTIAPKPKHGRTSHMEHKIPVPRASAASDPVVQSTKGRAVAPPLLHSFEGVAVQDSAPPDPNGAVGPAHYVQVVNESFQVFSKKGASLYGPVPTNTLWSGFGTDCEAQNDGDATVSYDRLANRWVLQQFAVLGSEFLECIAVSATGDPTGSWYRYAFSGFGDEFPDYPKLGVWPDGYYVAYNLFAGGLYWDGPEICAYNRTKMLAGESTETDTGMVQCQLVDEDQVGGLLPSDLDGPTPPPAGTPNLVMAFDTDKLMLWRYHVDWADDTQTALTGPIDIPVASFDPACGGGTCIPQRKYNQTLDGLGDRLMYRLAYRNFGDHQSIVVTHSVTAGAGVGVRWYELRDPAGTPTVYQQGTYAPDPNFRWMGSAAMDGAGGIALGYSLSGIAMRPSIAYTGRLAGDPLGTMTQGEGLLQAGAGSQGCCLSRWGDYSSMSIDPSDDCTFWYTNEYLPNDGTFNWHTRIGAFKLPGCSSAPASDFSVTAPASVTARQGDDAEAQVTTHLTEGLAQNVTLNVNGLPFGSTASFAPPTISSDGGASTMTISAGTETPPGTYTLTLLGTGETATQAATVSLVVTPSNAVQNGTFDDGLNGWGTAGTVAPIATVTTKKPATGHTPGPAAQLGAVAPVAGDSTITQTVTVPAGLSRLSFWYQPHCKGKAPADQFRMEIRSTGGGTLATPLAALCKSSSKWSPVTVDTSAFAGQDVVLWFNVVGTGAKGKAAYAYVDDVAVGPPVGGNVIVNGGFEPDLSSWTAAGAQAPTVAAPGHSGGFSAALGTSAGFGGSSTLKQTVIVPGGAPLLTFWYQPHCLDSIDYDQIQVQIRSVTNVTKLAILNTCAKATKWLKVSVPMAAYAGQQVVIALNVNDDGFPAAEMAKYATWAYFDDVSLS